MYRSPALAFCSHFLERRHRRLVQRRRGTGVARLLHRRNDLQAIAAFPDTVPVDCEIERTPEAVDPDLAFADVGLSGPPMAAGFQSNPEHLHGAGLFAGGS